MAISHGHMLDAQYLSTATAEGSRSLVAGAVVLLAVPKSKVYAGNTSMGGRPAL